MGGIDDDGSRSGRPTDGGRRSGDGQDANGDREPLATELRELYELYGDAGSVPERWLELARRISDAYERIATDNGDGASGRKRRS